MLIGRLSMNWPKSVLCTCVCMYVCVYVRLWGCGCVRVDVIECVHACWFGWTFGILIFDMDYGCVCE